jgi:uncharacterized protein (DUF486 family)
MSVTKAIRGIGLERLCPQREKSAPTGGRPDRRAPKRSGKAEESASLLHGRDGGGAQRDAERDPDPATQEHFRPLSIFNTHPVPPMPAVWPYILPVVLLLGSNLFMTLAWYGHLRFKDTPLFGVILASWAIAFIEYCLAVPANRYGSAVYSAAQLKTMQEVITLVVFAMFSVTYLKEPLGWNHAVGFALIVAGAFVVFQKW